MKRLLGTILTAGMLFLSACGTNSVYMSDSEITVDNQPIQGYSINNKLMIALEDLENYGFTVENQDGTLRITTDKQEDTEPLSAERVNLQIGTIKKSGAVVNGVGIDTYTDGNKNYASIETLGTLDDDYNKEWGYSDYNMKLTEADGAYNLECFRFSADAYDVMKEKEALVAEAEFDLYTESDEEPEHYGGLYEPQSGVIAGITGDGNGDESRNIPASFPHSFACYSNYIEFDLKQDFIYKPGDKLAQENDCLMLVPWNTSDVTQVYDNEDYMRRMLDMLAEYNKPVIVRYACEMNIGHLGDSPSAYVKAFRFVADIVHEYGMAVMWSPNDVGSYNRPVSLYYPGDEYVDWIGISCFMRPQFMQQETSREDSILFNSGDFAWHTNSVKYILDFMEKNNISKPIAVSEGGVLSLADYEGSTLTDEWAEARLGNMYWYLPMVYPQVKLITYFNHTSPGAIIGYDLSDKENYKQIIENALINGPYLLNYSDKAKFTFKKAAGREYKESIIPLYEYVYLPEEDTKSVLYYLDDVLLAGLTEIPYRYELDTSAVSDGEHILTVEIQGSENVYNQEFTLIKTGESVVIN